MTNGISYQRGRNQPVSQGRLDAYRMMGKVPPEMRDRTQEEFQQAAYLKGMGAETRPAIPRTGGLPALPAREDPRLSPEQMNALIEKHGLEIGGFSETGVPRGARKPITTTTGKPTSKDVVNFALKYVGEHIPSGYEKLVTGKEFDFNAKFQEGLRMGEKLYGIKMPKISEEEKPKPKDTQRRLRARTVLQQMRDETGRSYDSSEESITIFLKQNPTFK